MMNRFNNVVPIISMPVLLLGLIIPMVGPAYAGGQGTATASAAGSQNGENFGSNWQQFDMGYIGMPSGVAVGGPLQLTVNNDGHYTMSSVSSKSSSTTWHDSGFDNYYLSAAITLLGRDHITAYGPYIVTGHVDGHCGGILGCGGNHDFFILKTGNDPTIAQNWNDPNKSARYATAYAQTEADSAFEKTASNLASEIGQKLQQDGWEVASVCLSGAC